VYLYDGEGRLCAVEGPAPLGGSPIMTGYLYDADGARVAKGTITTMSCDPTANGFQFTENYVLGPGGEELTMLDGSNTWQRTNAYAAGKLLATYDLVSGNPALHFHLEDPLGTRRMQLSGEIATLGCPETDIQSLPYGDGLNTFPDPNTCSPATADDSTPLHFTGKERDSESNNDYFGARYYASSMGRFMSPDWSAQVEPVPYAKLDDPQSLNLYAYVDNNPITGVDLDGHDSLLDKWRMGAGGSSAVIINSAELQQNINSAITMAREDMENNELFREHHQIVYWAQQQAQQKAQQDPAPPVAAYVPGVAPGADGAAKALQQATRGIPKPTPTPIPRSVPGPDPVPPEFNMKPGEIPEIEPGASVVQKLSTGAALLLKLVPKIIGGASDFIVCVTCQHQPNTMHDAFCGKNNPSCSAELLREEGLNSAEELKVPRRS
jgi:RHS repeat-associated protein